MLTCALHLGALLTDLLHCFRRCPTHPHPDRQPAAAPPLQPVNRLRLLPSSPDSLPAPGEEQAAVD